MFSFLVPDALKGAIAKLFGVLLVGFMLMWCFAAAFHAWNRSRLQPFASDAESLTAAEMAALVHDHWSELHFTHLVMIDEDAAGVIAASKNWYLRFDAVTDLTPVAELALAGCGKRLDFRALRQIKTPALAARLASHDGVLKLDSLVELKPDIAAALATHEGDLSLNGVRDLSLEAAKALCRHCRSVTRRRIQRAGGIPIPFEFHVPVTVSLLGLDSPDPEVWGYLKAQPHVISQFSHDTYRSPAGEAQSANAALPVASSGEP